MSAIRGPEPTPGRSLRQNVVYAVGGMGAYSFAQFAVTVLLAKFTTPAILGYYFFALAVSTPIVLLLGLELRSVFVADARNEFSFGAYAALRMAALGVATILLGLLLGVVPVEDGGWARAFIGAVFASKIAWALAELGWGVFNRRERMDQMAGATLLRGLALLAPYAILLPLLILAADWAPLPAATLCAATTALGWLVVWWRYDLPRIRALADHDVSWDGRALARLARRAAPLGFVAMTVNLCDSLPRIVVKSGGSAEQLGFFGALAALALVGNLVVVQAGNAAANRLSRGYQRADAGYTRLLTRLFVLAAGVGGVLCLAVFGFGGRLLAAFYQPEYARYLPELRIVAIAQTLALFTSVFGIAVTQMRRFWLQVPAQALTLAATAIAAIVLIPPNPVQGAAWTALVRAATQFAAYAFCFGVGWRARPDMAGEALDVQKSSDNS